jgi:hypothetical protein
MDADVDGSASLVDRVCIAAVSLLSLKGAGLSLMVDGELCGTAGVSEPGIAIVQELQLTLGEGPCVDAWTSRAPVLEANLDDPVIVRWPAFAQAGVDAGVLAVFAFPLHLGAIRIGVLVLYRGHSGMLNADEMAYGLVLADMATQVLLALQAGAPVGVLHEVLASEPSRWAEVHQATGMISVQLDVSLDEAFVRLRAHAFAEGLPLRTVAREIVMRRHRLQGPT